LATSVYNPKNVVANFGPLPLRGYADGSMIEISMQGDGVQAVVGTQGEAVLIDNHDFSAEATHRFMATGEGRVTLERLHRHLKTLNLPLPYTLTSIDTGEVIAGGVAKIKNFPDASFGDDAPVREVVFVIAQLEFTANPAL
jgi:hypothetical protein